MFIKIFFIFGLIGGFFASVMAFLIAYEEYQKHHFQSSRLFKEAFSMATMAFFVIFFIMIISGIFLSVVTFYK